MSEELQGGWIDTDATVPDVDVDEYAQALEEFGASPAQPPDHPLGDAEAAGLFT